MAISVVNQWTVAVADIDAEITTFPTSGNWLVAVVTARVTDGSAPLLNLGDFSRNVWTLLYSDTAEAHAAHAGAQLQAEVWACPAAMFAGWDFLNVYASAMQISASDVGSMCVNVFEVAGMGNNALTVDSVTPGTASAAASLALTAPAPSGSADCLMVATAVADSATAITPSGAGWTGLTPVTRSGPDTRVAAAWREATTGGAVTFTLSAGTANWAGVVVALRQTGVPVPQPNPAWPGAQFQVGLGYDLSTPLSRVKWTGQTKRLLEFHGDGGIQSELGTAQQGQSDLVIDNRDGAYSPRTAGAATANAAGTTTTIKIPDASAANINKGDFFRVTNSSGVLKEFTVFQVVSTASAAGTTTVTFKRADGGSGALAATASGDNYVGIPIDLYIPYRLLETWAGVTYVTASGWLRDLPVAYDGAAYSEVQAVATDALETLTTAAVSSLRGEILRRNPTHYWPLDDASGSGYATNASGVSTAVLTQTTSKFGGGTNTTADFGAATQDLAMGVGGVQSLLGDQGSGWAQTGQSAAEIATKGYALVGSTSDFPPITGGVTVFGVLAVTDAQATTIAAATTDPTILVLRNTDPATGTGQGSVLKLSITRVTGRTNITVWDKATHAATTTATGFQITGDLVSWAITFTTSAWTFYRDGAAEVSGAANLVSTFSGIGIGGEADAFFNGHSLPGLHVHCAVFGRVLSAGEIRSLRNTTALGGPIASGETIAQFAERKLNTIAWKGTRVLGAGAAFIGDGAPSGSIGDTVAEAAGYGDGLLFTDAASQLQYRDRVTAYQQAPRAVLGEDTTGGEIPYQPGVAFGYNPAFLYNDVEIDNTRTFEPDLGTTLGTTSTFVAVDEISARKYGSRTLARSTKFLADSDAWDMTWWYLSGYAYPQRRVETVTIEAAAAGARWPFVLGVEIGDLITVTKRPIGAPSFSIRCRVLRRQPSRSYGEQTTGSITLTLAAAPLRVSVLNDPVLGIVGDTAMGA